MSSLIQRTAIQIIKAAHNAVGYDSTTFTEFPEHPSFLGVLEHLPSADILEHFPSEEPLEHVPSEEILEHLSLDEILEPALSEEIFELPPSLVALNFLPSPDISVSSTKPLVWRSLSNAGLL